jgi:hypothetical protein
VNTFNLFNSFAIELVFSCGRPLIHKSCLNDFDKKLLKSVRGFGYMIKSEDILNDFEVVEFRFLTTDDEYDTKYEWWSRMYEYKIVLNMLEN